MIIGLSGKLGVGKSYYTQFLVEELRKGGKVVLELAFADQIKVNALVKNQNLLRDQVYLKKTPDSRRMLQLEGTEKGRDVYGEDYWIRYMEEWIYLWKLRGVEYFVISDVRFENEAKFILNQGGMIARIHAPELNQKRLIEEYPLEHRKEISTHISETGLDTFQHFTISITNTLYRQQTTYNKSVLKDCLLVNV